ncbi:hypothetical protein EWM64_g757 [Hericium alpestre]|uniref:Synembryn-A n=1 Tax=Hericium alpestre TaxID=135208 RepID=A0A4Z0A843_9AGAM|nr:hypothetical protein EWM64_g757 [Hericium alpestre]
MAGVLQTYTSLSSASSTSEKSRVLQSIVDASPLSINDNERKELVVSLLNDLNLCKSSDGRLSTKDAALALTALKTLGKHPSAAAVMASAKNMSTLSSLARTLKDDFDASCEALRCIANTMLLIESARGTWISDSVKGGEDTVQLLHLVDCDRVTDFGAGEGKVLGEYWSDRLDGILPPLLRAFNTLPPTFPSPLAPPLTHIIHSLISIPITSNLRPIWLPSPPSSPRSSPRSASNTGSPVLSSDNRPLHGDGPSSPEKEKGGGSGAIGRALHALSAGRRSLSSRPTSPSSSAITSYDTLLRAYDLMEVSFSHFFPGNTDVDDKTIRQRAQEETDGTLDELFCPLVMLITKACIADQNARMRVKDWILPANLDRSGSALESRPDLLGRCLRLLASVYHPRLKDATGEMLFAICNSDATTLASQVGYGNVAGFLFNKGIMNAPPAAAPGDNVPTETPSGVPINPITGVAQEDRPMVEMTEEEKEQEAERLFVLFDRLERSGALPPNQNPIRRAVQSGHFG